MITQSEHGGGPNRMTLLWAAVALVVASGTAGCTGAFSKHDAASSSNPHRVASGSGHGQGPSPRPRPNPATTRAPKALGTVRPAWLGHRELPLRPDGFGRNLPTPPALRNRRFPTVDILPPPRHLRFSASISRVPEAVLQRSTYRPGCPVNAADLRYVRLSFWGFDHEVHRGEMLVNASVVRSIVGVFHRLFAAHFPIEELRITTKHDLHAHPTGDGNYSGSFECRPVTAGTEWSEHAYGMAVDVNPFQNPYVRPGLVVPELASAYEDRGWVRPGMIEPGGPVVAAFAEIGWKWGGDWHTLKDYMHFSATGR